MHQTTLFPQFESAIIAPATKPAAEQAAQLYRVAANLAEIVMDFLWLKGTGSTFHMADLQSFVAERCKSAPASPDRILRDLRQRQRCDYKIVDRRGSKYKITRLGE